tara:strand:+ start:36 stop:260 length:225 start_codon:yes stop_codon:yes gene_type:complete
MTDDPFTYDRSWAQIDSMLRKAEKKQNKHAVQVSNNNLTKKERLFHARNFKALEGVIKSLRWVLGDKDIEHPLE